MTTFTARQIVVKALRELKVIAANESGSAADLDVGFQALNDLLDSWSLSPNNIMANTLETFNASGLQQYSIGPAGVWVTATPPIAVPLLVYTIGGVDYSVSQINEDQYSEIPQKNTTGQPQWYWFTKGGALDYINVWPVPASGTFTVHSLKPMTSFTDLDTNYTSGPGYKNALAYALAVDIAPSFETEASKTTLVKAMNAKRVLQSSNAVIPLMNSGVPLYPFRYAYRE